MYADAPRWASTVNVLLRQMLQGVAYERWRALATLYNLDEIGTDTMYPDSAPHGGGKDLLLLDCIDRCVYKSPEA